MLAVINICVRIFVQDYLHKIIGEKMDPAMIWIPTLVCGAICCIASLYIDYNRKLDLLLDPLAFDVEGEKKGRLFSTGILLIGIGLLLSGGVYASYQKMRIEMLAGIVPIIIGIILIIIYPFAYKNK